MTGDCGVDEWDDRGSEKREDLDIFLMIDKIC